MSFSRAEKVPGPFVRVKVGDALKNANDSMMMHNVDFHAVTGPGGGAKFRGTTYLSIMR